MPPDPDPPRLFVSHDRALHHLTAVEFGRVTEDQPPDRWRIVSDDCAFLLDEPVGRTVGFILDGFDAFDPDDPELAAIWTGPRFHAPALGLTDALAGEIAIAAHLHFGGRNSVDRHLPSLATASTGREALVRWTHCLEAGDATAHHAIGRTLLELDRPAEAYAHLRHYTEIAPAGSWTWNLLGRAAEATGETGEARAAYVRAIELSPPDGQAGKVDAEERLAGLEGWERG